MRIIDCIILMKFMGHGPAFTRFMQVYDFVVI